MKRYKKYQGFNCRFSFDPLNEAVINPQYVQEVNDTLYTNKKYIQNLNTSNLVTFCFLLSKKFKKFAIRFVVDTNPDYDRVDKEFMPIINTILVLIVVLLKNYTNIFICI